MTKINLEAARAAYVGAATKDAATLDVYAGQISEALGKSWAQIAKKKAKDCSEQEKLIRDATQEERAAFYAAIEASYKGKGKWQDVARVYWNRVVAHALPPKPKGAGATAERSLEEYTMDIAVTALRRYARNDDLDTPNWVINLWAHFEEDFLDQCPGMTREKLYPST